MIESADIELVLYAGVDEEGNPILKRTKLKNLTPNLTSQQYSQIVSAIAGLTRHTLHTATIYHKEYLSV